MIVTLEGAVPLNALNVSHALFRAVVAVHERVPAPFVETLTVRDRSAVLPTAAESRSAVGENEGVLDSGGPISSSSWQVETATADNTTATPAVRRARSEVRYPCPAVALFPRTHHRVDSRTGTVGLQLPSGPYPPAFLYIVGNPYALHPQCPPLGFNHPSLYSTTT